MIIQPIVEGPGDERAVPILIRRVLSEIIGCPVSQCLRPMKLDRGKMVKEGPCVQHIRISQLNQSVDHVLLLADADTDCCKNMNELIKTWADVEAYRTGFDVICIEKEFECWLLAAIDSLIGVRGIQKVAMPFADVNNIRGAKGRLSALMPENSSYSETADQPALTAVADLQSIITSSPSFSRFVEKLKTAHAAKCTACATNLIQNPA